MRATRTAQGNEKIVSALGCGHPTLMMHNSTPVNTSKWQLKWGCLLMIMLEVSILSVLFS